MQEPRFHGREEAREKLTKKAADMRRLAEQIASEAHLPAQLRRTVFCTIDPVYLAEDAEFRLRWIDCAPDGANHLLAPLQDKNGVPCGGVFSENIGPGPALRNARAARGLHPINGRPV